MDSVLRLVGCGLVGCGLVGCGLGSVQLVLFCGSLVALYFLFTKTAYFQAGLFGRLFSKFRRLCLAAPVNMLLLLAARGTRLALLLDNTPPLLLWTPLFSILYVAQRVAYMWFYYEVLKTVRDLNNPSFYRLSLSDIQQSFASR